MQEYIASCIVQPAAVTAQLPCSELLMPAPAAHAFAHCALCDTSIGMQCPVVSRTVLKQLCAFGAQAQLRYCVIVAEL